MKAETLVGVLILLVFVSPVGASDNLVPSVTFHDPVSIWTNPTPGHSVGHLNLGCDSSLDGDALLHVKGCFTNHDTASPPANGVGNEHAGFFGLIHERTLTASYLGQAIALVGSATVRSTNTSSNTGNFFGVLGEVNAEPGSSGTFTNVRAFQSDAYWNGATASALTGYWFRNPGGNGPIGTLHGMHIEPIARASTNAVGVWVGKPTGGEVENRSIYAEGDTVVGPAGYLQFQASVAGVPSSADCDADSERGRLVLDVLNARLYVCNGAARGWDWVALND